MAARNGHRSARNEDWTDREILGIVQDLINEDGEATTTSIGERMGFKLRHANGNGRRETPATKVGGRLGWMRSGGLLSSYETDPEADGHEPGDRDLRWDLTDIGYDICTGRLTKAVSGALGKMTDGDRVLLARELMRATWIDGNDGGAFAIDRQIKHERAQQKRSFR